MNPEADWTVSLRDALWAMRPLLRDDALVVEIDSPGSGPTTIVWGCGHFPRIADPLAVALLPHLNGDLTVGELVGDLLALDVGLGSEAEATQLVCGVVADLVDVGAVEPGAIPSGEFLHRGERPGGGGGLFDLAMVGRLDPGVVAMQSACRRDDPEGDEALLERLDRIRSVADQRDVDGTRIVDLGPGWVRVQERGVVPLIGFPPWAVLERLDPGLRGRPWRALTNDGLLRWYQARRCLLPDDGRDLASGRALVRQAEIVDAGDGEIRPFIGLVVPFSAADADQAVLAIASVLSLGDLAVGTTRRSEFVADAVFLASLGLRTLSDLVASAESMLGMTSAHTPAVSVGASRWDPAAWAGSLGVVNGCCHSMKLRNGRVGGGRDLVSFSPPGNTSLTWTRRFAGALSELGFPAADVGPVADLVSCVDTLFIGVDDAAVDGARFKLYAQDPPAGPWASFVERSSAVHDQLAPRYMAWKWNTVHADAVTSAIYRTQRATDVAISEILAGVLPPGDETQMLVDLVIDAGWFPNHEASRISEWLDLEESGGRRAVYITVNPAGHPVVAFASALHQVALRFGVPSADLDDALDLIAARRLDHLVLGVDGEGEITFTGYTVIE